jgi:transcriptional regulator with XRE-family HTH domain
MANRNALSELLDSSPRLAKLARESAGLSEIAALLLELRQQLGLSQKEFARRAGLSKTMVSELENAANTGVTLKTLSKIAKGGGLKLCLAFETASAAAEVGVVTASLNLKRYVLSMASEQTDYQDGLAA